MMKNPRFNWLFAFVFCLFTAPAWSFDSKMLDQECARVVLKNGDTILVNLLQINANNVKYKRCGESYPEIMVKKSNIQTVIAADGSVLYLSKTPIKEPKSKNNDAEFNGFAIAGFVLTMVSLLIGGPILSIPGIIFGAIALIKIRKNPGKYQGRILAILAIVFGIVSILLTALLVLILFV
jgi:Domain of unknown function (DUF4190)